VQQEEENNQQSQELAEARKNYASESEKVREGILVALKTKICCLFYN